MSTLEQAQSAIASKNWQAAEPMLRQALDTQPESHELLFLYGQTCFKLGRYVAADAALLAALRLQPDDPPCLFYLSVCAMATGQPKQAIPRLERYLVLVPDDVEGWKQLGLAQSATKGYEAALAAFNKALKLAPHDIACLRQIYRLQFLLGQDDACRTSYQQALTVEEPPTTARQLVLARVVSTETWELLANNWVQLHLKSEPAGTTTRIRPSLTRHDRARLLTPEWLVLTANNDILIEQMTHNPVTLPTKGPHVPALTAERCLLDLPQTPDMVIDDACILVGGSRHYYHWLIDFLPRIGIAHKVPALRDLNLLVNENPADWQWASLEALGISREQILQAPASALVQCRALWVPTLLSRITTPHTYVTGFLRRRLLTREMKSQPARRLFILPPADAAGHLANSTELTTCLNEMGFEPIIPEQIPFMEQVAAFAVAEMIVSPSLPALTNLLFAPAGALIIEIQSPSNPAAFFQSLANSVGLRYRRCTAQPQVDASENAGGEMLYLNPATLSQAIRAGAGVPA